MASRQIKLEIVVDDKGTHQIVKVEREVERLAHASKRAGSSMERSFAFLKDMKGTLAAGLGGAGFAMMARDAVRVADSMTLLHNRLNLVGGDMEDLFKLATETHQSMEATATVYTRLARAVEDYGYTTKDVLDVTKALNQAVLVSGASAEEASAGLMQLSQGLALGRLQGQDLKSVMSMIPAVARMIAEGMGVSVGQLRELGKQGQITTQQIMDAILKMKDSVDAEAKTMQTTVSQSMTDFSSAVAVAVDKINHMEGATGGLADTIQWLSKIVAKAPEAWAGFKTVIDAMMYAFVDLEIKIDEFHLKYLETIKSINDNPVGDFIVPDFVANAAEREIKKVNDSLTDEKLLLKEINKGWEEHYKIFQNGYEYEKVKREKTRRDKGGAGIQAQAQGQPSKLTATQLSSMLSQAANLKNTFAMSGMGDEERAYARIDAQYDHYWKKIQELATKAPEKFKEMFGSIDEARAQWAEAWNNETEAAIERFNKMADAGTEAMQDVSDTAYNTSQYVTDMWTYAMQGMSDATQSFFVDALDGKFKDLGASFEKMIKNMLAQWLAAQAQMALFGGTAGKLGGLIGAGVQAISNWWNPSSPVYGDQATMLYTGWRHDGGVVGESAPSKAGFMPAAMFAGAPRLHNGLMPDEYPAILQKGETVLPRGTKAGSPVTVNIFEAPGTQAKVRQRDNGNGGMTLDVIISQIEDRMSNNVAMGRGSLAPVLQSTYGLNRTAGSYR